MKSVIAAAMAVSLVGCSAFLSQTPAQRAATIQVDEQKLIYTAKALGCVAHDAAGTAQELGLSAHLDSRGNAVLTKVADGAGKVCSATVPASTLAPAVAM